MRYLFAALGLIGVLAVLGGLKASQISLLIDYGTEMQKAGPPPEAVGAVAAERQTWERTLDAVASVVSAQGVVLSNEAPGVVTRLHFDSGALVKRGQILLELDTSVERAQLGSTRARRDLAEISANRSRALVTSGAVARAEVDANESSLKSLTADASAIRAQIERKVVRAPFSGKLGLREVNLGQYLAPGSRVTVLESTESVYVDFTLPQREAHLVKLEMPVRVSLDGQDGVAAEGVISAIDPAMDPVTRTIKVRASIPNETSRLLPGMFARVAVVLPERPEVVAIPLTAVVRASYGDSVFVVEDPPRATGASQNKVARQRFVRLGEARGDFVSVLEGVKAGETVVTAGAFKLRNGAPVTIDNEVALEPKLDPKPENR